MGKIARRILIVIAVILAIYLIICASLIYQIKHYTKVASGLFPYETTRLMTEDEYWKLSTHSIFNEAVNRHKLPPANQLGVSDSSISTKVDFEWTGIGTAYFDFASGSFIVSTPFDYEATYGVGDNYRTLTGHCNRRVTIVMDGGFLSIGEISSDYGW